MKTRFQAFAFKCNVYRYTAAHAWHRDYPALCLDMQQLGLIPPGTDVMPLARRIPALMDPWLDGGGGRNFDPEVGLCTSLIQLTHSA